VNCLCHFRVTGKPSRIWSWKGREPFKNYQERSLRLVGMYGPPHDCKGKLRDGGDKSAQMYSAFDGDLLSWP